MSSTVRTILITLAFLLIFDSQSVIAQAPSPQTVKWETITSDDGRFTVELPATLRHFFDTEGFLLSFNSSEFQVRDVRVINAYIDNTLISVDSFRAPKSALTVIWEREKQSRSVETGSSFKLGDVEIRNLRCKRDEVSCTRWYFALDEHIYILTAASREDQSPVSKRFLDSVKIVSVGDPSNSSSIPFRELVRHNVALENLSEEAARALTKGKDLRGTVVKEAGVLPFAIVHNPGPYFTNSARSAMAQGEVQFIAMFGSNGMIEKLQVVRSTANGLTRQAIFSALRIKFLPPIRDGRPENATRPISYSFQVR